MSTLRWVDGFLVTEPDPSPAEKAWRRTSGAASVLAAVEARLVAAGAVTELRQFYGLSAQEQDRLVWLERNESTRVESQGRSPSGPQATDATVAA